VIEPLRLTFRLECSPSHAFYTWTERFGDWWPGSHTVTGDPTVQVIFEPGLGGRIFERGPDGSETHWGEITAWEPPRKLAYLWHIRRDRADATDVELNFLPLDDGATSLEIVHTGWERLGVEGPAWREANQAGWSGVIGYFIDACTR
jgi:uncharacterized protein YndB with AHSA1/START domain